ncbi:MAG: hypothetical protein IPL32_18900 [Chloracidobacterium sp.]|nr:hypothetical protein [Chloracidobacterium sp.]
MSTKKELELDKIPESTDEESAPEKESEAPKSRAVSPRNVEAQKKLAEEKVISDAVIPSGQFLVEKGRQFIAALEQQPLMPTMVMASANDQAGMRQFEIQGVKINVPTGKPINIPESVASLIRDNFGY